MKGDGGFVGVGVRGGTTETLPSVAGPELSSRYRP